MNNPECQNPDTCQIDKLLHSKIGIGEVIALCQAHLNYYTYLKANDPFSLFIEEELTRFKEILGEQS